MRHALLFVLLAACAPSETTSTTESDISTATIDFAKDWSVRRSGDLVPGSTTTIRYDLARLSKCRATKYGLQAWAVAAYASFDGQKPVELLIAPVNPNAIQT